MTKDHHHIYKPSKYGYYSLTTEANLNIYEKEIPTVDNNNLYHYQKDIRLRTG